MENVSNQAINEGSKPSADIIKPKSSIFTFLKISSLLAFFTAYSHFFGYSFLRGKIEAMGFHSSNIDPSVNELLYQASEGVALGAYGILVDYILTKNILWISLANCVVFVVVGVYGLYKDSLIGYFRRAKEPPVDEKKKRINSGVLLVIFGAMGFAWQAIVAVLVLLCLALLFSGMSLGQQLGGHYIEYLVKSGVCETTDWDKSTKKYAVSCLSIEDGEKAVYGRIIYQDSDQTYFMSNDASYALNKDYKIVQKALIIKRPIDPVATSKN